MTSTHPSAVLVDTSALFALLDADDENHRAAVTIFEDLVTHRLRSEARYVTHSFAIVESIALVQNRLGLDAVRDLVDDIVPLLDIEWVGPDLHDQATTSLLAAGRRTVSLVDWTSFVLMRREGIDTAFAYDADFEQQGFRLLEPTA